MADFESVLNDARQLTEDEQLRLIDALGFTVGDVMHHHSTKRIGKSNWNEE